MVRPLETLDATTAELLRGKTPWQRLEMAASMWRTARELIYDHLRQEHPDWNEERIARETARRLSHGAF
jgi:hypothetical protein